MRHIIKTPLSEAQNHVTKEQLEQDITDLEIENIENLQDMTDMDIRITELEEKKGG